MLQRKLILEFRRKCWASCYAMKVICFASERALTTPDTSSVSLKHNKVFHFLLLSSKFTNDPFPLIWRTNERKWLKIRLTDERWCFETFGRKKKLLKTNQRAKCEKHFSALIIQTEKRWPHANGQNTVNLISARNKRKLTCKAERKQIFLIKSLR